MARRTKKSIFISIVILLILVVIFPLISLKYLDKGLEFRRHHLSKLDTLGVVVDYSAINLDGKTVSKELALGNVVLISHEQMACDPQFSLTLKEYVGKFENQDVFKHVVLKDKARCDSWIESYIAERDENKGLFDQFNEFVGIDDRINKVILVDRQGQVRSVYDLTQRKDLESLVTHTTILMPPLKKR